MIYGVRNVEHNIYLFHEHIAYIFRQMFAYCPEKFDEAILVRPEFLPILKKAHKTIYVPLIEIVEIYHNLSYGSKKQLEIAFSINNSIDTLSNKDAVPIKFSDIDPKISNKLKSFCENLWTEYPQVVQMMSDFGTVKDHYDKLTHEDNFPGIVCPFCGLETFEPSEGKYREDYDHLLAKAVYPFVSINFNLLIPTCKKCNSNEKRATDTLLRDDGLRRVVYNPYDTLVSSDSLIIDIIPKEQYDTFKLESLLRSISWDFDIKRDATHIERLESWDQVYGVKRRYKEWINRLEKEWFYELQRTFKRQKSLGVAYEDFQNDFMQSAKYQILIAGFGVIKYSYFRFLFASNNFEVKLNDSLS